VSRQTPDRPDNDEAFIAQLVSEAGDPNVEPRPEHVAELRARIHDNLGPPRADRWSRTLWLVVSGLAAACLAAVLAWPRGDGNAWVRGSSAGQASVGIAPAPREDSPGVAAWPNIRRGLDLSQMPAFSWPVEQSPRLSGLASIPPDLVD
jgi:hypothetical protein